MVDVLKEAAKVAAAHDENEHRLWTDYWVAVKPNGSVEEGLCPRWYRVLTAALRGWKWTKA